MPEEPFKIFSYAMKMIIIFYNTKKSLSANDGITIVLLRAATFAQTARTEKNYLSNYLLANKLIPMDIGHDWVTKN